MSNLYQFYCDNCHYKRITDGTNVKDLTEIKTSDIPRGNPTLDPNAKKTITNGGLHNPSEIQTKIIVPPSIKQIKKFKCPNCGYVIKPKKIKEEK